VWHRQYLVVENSSMHGPYNVIFQGSIQKDGGDIALDDVVFTYNCKLQSDEPNTTPTTPPPEEITSCNFEDEQLCGWRLDLELNETERFHFERKSGNEMLAGFLPNADHNGDKEAHFMWADAAFGNKNEVTAMSSPKVENIADKLCFNFWFDVRVDAGIKYLQIETEVKDDPNTRQIAWHLTPDHGVDNWQVGRVSVKRGQPYKIVITTQRSNAALGYVAIDDFEFIYGTEDCSIMPELARPTTTTTTTTPPSSSSSSSLHIFIFSFSFFLVI